jgi:hypothetical protein
MGFQESHQDWLRLIGMTEEEYCHYVSRHCPSEAADRFEFEPLAPGQGLLDLVALYKRWQQENSFS